MRRWWRLRDRFEGLEPQADRSAERRDTDAAEGFLKSVQTAQARSQQRNGSAVVATLKMVESSSDLNQPLQKRLLRLLCREPHRFPMFVRLEERAGMEAAQALAQVSLGPIE